MPRPRPIRFAAAALALALALAVAACGRDGGDGGPPERGDVAVARVDGKTVWVSDVKREAIAQGLIGEGEPFDTSADQFRRILDEVVDQRLLAAEAVRRKIDKDALAQRRLASARDRLLGDMLVESVVADAVTEDNIKGLYEEQQKLSRRSEEIRARQIVMGTAAEVEALKKLIAAGASFEALAMERSRDAATRFNGGDLGYFTTDVMPETYDVALKDAKPGQLVGPFAVEGGFALVKVEDRRPEQPMSLETARPQIVRFLTYDRIRDLLEKLRADAKVETLVKPQAGVPRALPPADAPKVAPAAPPAKGATP